MHPSELLSREDAVSPVIGVILMVAITVILAAVIGTFVLGFGSDLNQAPQASFTFSFENGATNQADALTITHDGGATIQASQLSANGNAALDTVSGTNSGTTGQALSFSDLGAPTEVTAGTSVTVYAASGNTNGLNDDTIRVTWQSASGDSTATLGKWTGPDA